MIGRRTLLTLLGSGAATAASGVSVKDALSLNVPSGENEVAGPSPYGEVVGGECTPQERLIGELRTKLYDEMDRLSYQTVHLECYKSWSPIFKHHIKQQERQRIRNLLDRLERDRGFAQAIAEKLLGGDA